MHMQPCNFLAFGLDKLRMSCANAMFIRVQAELKSLLITVRHIEENARYCRVSAILGLYF